ncbi:VHS1068 protein [Vibrio phage 1]|nr:VHS1068 protein [Vibrio phage 1]
MNTLDTLKELLGVGSEKVSGTVSRVGSSVTVATRDGSMIVSKPPGAVNVGDLVIIESNQITYNLGKAKEIPTYDT